MKKLIFHIDLDAFFCGCEEIVNPELRGKPFVVSGRTKRSVIGCASYAARKFGVKAGKPVFMVINQCPGLITVPGHFQLYDDMSRKFFDFIKKHYTNKCEEMSIDEGWLDATNLVRHYNNDPILLAKKLQSDVKRILGLSVSIGISWNKFIAKMATDLNKPYGITTVLTQNELEQKIWTLPIEDMFFVGPPTAKRLRNININTIGDLAKFEHLKLLEATLDRNWYTTWQNALGNGDDFVDVSKNDPKSQSVSHTLLDPTNDPIEIETTLKYIAKELEYKLKTYKMAGSVVSIIYKYDRTTNHVKNISLNHLVYKYEDLYKYAMNLLGLNWNGETMIRLLGISVSKLQKIENITTIESKLLPKRKTKLSKLVNEINKKLGQDLVFIAKDKFMDN